MYYYYHYNIHQTKSCFKKKSLLPMPPPAGKKTFGSPWRWASSLAPVPGDENWCSSISADWVGVSLVCGGFLKCWYPQNTPKCSFLVGKLVVGYHHFRKPLCTPWKINGWNLQIIHLERKKWSSNMAILGISGAYTPWKINDWNIIPWRFGSDHFPF